MKTQKSSPVVITVLKNLLVTIVALLPGLCGAQTILSGNISGTWSPSGNPYVITDNATVQSGQTLTIQPGVIVWIGQGLSITVNGAISAVGTPASHITFQAPTGSLYWNNLTVNNSFTNRFNYCDFANATNALVFNNQGNSSNQVWFSTFQNVANGITMTVNEHNWTLSASIANCAFSNCWVQAVSGSANSYYVGATIVSAIKNCTFSSIKNGCSFNLFTTLNPSGATGNVQLIDNLFRNVTNTAISLTCSAGSSSLATLINNIIVNANNGVIFQDPWDAKMQNCILVGCTNAAKVTGSLSRSVSYNDFFGNATNFIGYPSTYGQIIIANRNGTPCDLLYNIFSNPLFVSTSDFTLQTNSPCIDAGTPDVTYMDMSFPPSQGTGFPDLGIYGGPLAVNWQANIPVTPAPLTLLTSKALKLTCTNVMTAGSYQLETSTNLSSWTNCGSQFYMTATSNLFQYVDVTNNAGFFRLKSLP